MGDLLERGAQFIETESPGGGNVHRGKFIRADDVEVEMHNELARVGMQMSQRVGGYRSRALGLNLIGGYMAQRRPGQEFLFERIQPGQTEQGDVRLADQRRLAPEADQLGSASAN